MNIHEIGLIPGQSKLVDFRDDVWTYLGISGGLVHVRRVGGPENEAYFYPTVFPGYAWDSREEEEAIG